MTEVKHAQPQPDISQWRARAIHVLLLAVAAIGLPAWGAVVLNAWRAGQMSALVWIYVVVYTAILALALLPRIDYRLRIWGLMILGYVNGAASLARLGLDGSGRLYLLLVPVFTTVLVGTRAGLATAFTSLTIYVLFAAQAGAETASLWMEAGVALAAFVLAAVVLLGRYSRFQLLILGRERRARRDLEAAQAQLEAYSATLEERVQERTAALAQAKRQAEAANERFAQELQFAGRIQTSFMASELPQIPSWQHAGALVPARETSGDFYNIFPLPGGRYGILIADVVDKGVGAALFMALCWALLHTYARQHPDDPGGVLAAVNRRILRDTHAGQFVTVVYGVLEPRTGILHYANGGHPPPYRFRERQLLALARTGIPLGILPQATWETETMRLQEDDLLVLYTDGVTEAQNESGDFFDRQRLAAVLRRHEGRSAREIREALLAELARFTGDIDQVDDITLLVLAREVDMALQSTKQYESIERIPVVNGGGL